MSFPPLFPQLGFDRVVLLETTFKEIRIPQDLFELYVKEMKNAYGGLEGVLSGELSDRRCR